MLGSLTEAHDAVQDTWQRLSRSGAGGVENLGGWLTTIVARVCLHMLRSRHLRRKESLSVDLPDPLVFCHTNYPQANCTYPQARRGRVHPTDQFLSPHIRILSASLRFGEWCICSLYHRHVFCTMLYTYNDVASIMYPFMMSFYVLFMVYLDGVHRHSNLM